MSKLSMIFIILFLLSFSACGFILPDKMPEGWGHGPRPYTGIAGFPPATNDYGIGFRDGCRLGWRAVAFGAMTNVGVKFDAQKMVNNPDYSAGFGDGQVHCMNQMDWEIP